MTVHDIESALYAHAAAAKWSPERIAKFHLWQLFLYGYENDAVLWFSWYQEHLSKSLPVIKALKPRSFHDAVSA